MPHDRGGPGPDRLVLVAGTGTEVGKTWVASRLIGVLRAGGAAVAARKPAQSADPGDDPAGLDAAVLARASGEQADEVCLPARSYEIALAPPMAADALGRAAFSVADLVGELAWPRSWSDTATHPRVGVVETAGGVRSPQADDGDVVDLMARLKPDLVVLVADAGLGTLNAVRLSADALTDAGRLAPERLAVVLNRFDPGDDLHRRNRSWLTDRVGLSVLVMPGDDERLAALALR